RLACRRGRASGNGSDGFLDAPNATRHHPPVDLLERELYLASLADYAADAHRGVSRVVLVSGEAGVGKTSLLDALRGRVGDARWLVGICDGSYTPRPLGPLFDIADEVGGALAQACLA